jgi:arsenite methyltransferase
MSLIKFLASQLARPSGFFGKYVTVRLLNRLNVPINRLALETLRLGKDDRVLEIGFGGGALIEEMVRIADHVSGVDISPEACQVCSRKFRQLIAAGRVDLHCAPVENLPFPSGAFTRAVSVNAIYFWPDPLRALGQVHRTLRPEGLLVICFNPRNQVEKKPIARHGFRLYEPDEVAALLTEAGFFDVGVAYSRHRFGICAAVWGRRG